MTFQGAFLEEQGVRFGIVVVDRKTLSDSAEVHHLVETFRREVFGAPVVLMAQDEQGAPSWVGRPDLIRFLARTPMNSIPWREYTIERATRRSA